jgi:hypothetical protein
MKSYPVPIILVLAAWMLFMVACERPFSSDDLTENQLALNATFSPEQGFLVFISPVTPFSQTNPAPLLEQAEVRVTSGGLHFGTLLPARLGDRPVFYLSTPPQENIPYTLEVRVPGHPPISANDRLPLRANARLLEAYQVEKTLLPQGGTRYVVKLQMELEDRPIADNYYHLFLEARLKDASGQNYFVLSTIKNALNNDPSLSPYVLNESLLVDGRRFDGQTKMLDLQCQFEVPEGFTLQHLEMDLRHVSFPYFRFHQTHYAQLISAVNSLSEPVALYSNVQHGRGFFGGFVSTRDTLVIE